MNIEKKIKGFILWIVHFGIGRRYIISTRWYQIIERTANSIENKKRITLTDIEKLCKGREEKELVLEICKLLNRSIFQNVTFEDGHDKIIKLAKTPKVGTEIIGMLEYLAIMSGQYCIAYELRKCSEEKLIKKYEKRKVIKSYDVIPLFWAYISNEDFEAAEKVICRCSILYKIFFIKEIEFMTNFLLGKAEYNLINKQKKEHIKFEKIIKNKSVLVLGPMGEIEQTQRYVDKSDAVITMTYRDNLIVDVGNKKLISYYNGEVLRKMGEQTVLQYIKKIEMAVFKEIEYPYQVELCRKEKARNAYGGQNSFYDRTEGIYFSFLYASICESNMLQRILLDVMLFGCKKIRVANTNLFLSQKRYNNNYVVPGITHNINKDRRAFAIHNMINMYQMTKFLYDTKFIEVDNELKEVLDMGLKQYMNKMQELER